MVMDIRDYLPPSLKHVMAYTSQAEREKRQQAARDAFGHPTPVPPGLEPGPSVEPGDVDEPTLKVQPASPWAARAKGAVDKEMLPSALVPPVTVSAKPARAKRAPRATVRVIPLWVVMLTAVVGLTFGGIVIAWKSREPRPQGASPSPPATATQSTAVMPSAAQPVMGVVPLAVTSASAAPSAMATAVPSVTATAAPSVTVKRSANAAPSASADSDNPYAEPPRRPDVKPLRPQDY